MREGGMDEGVHRRWYAWKRVCMREGRYGRGVCTRVEMKEGMYERGWYGRDVWEYPCPTCLLSLLLCFFQSDFGSRLHSLNEGLKLVFKRLCVLLLSCLDSACVAQNGKRKNKERR